MLRALRLCIVALFVCAACVESAPPSGEDPPDETDPIGLGGGGGWEGSNCMGADYDITLRDDLGNLVEVRQSTAIGIVVDSIELSSEWNDAGGLEVQIERLEEFEELGLLNWKHKIAETLLPDDRAIAAYDPVTGEYTLGHYNLLGILSACAALVDGPLNRQVARTLAMFLYALSQVASCPDPEMAEMDGNFVSVNVRMQATKEWARLLPNAPRSPTLQELFDANTARPIPPWSSPDPSMTCILWEQPPQDVAARIAQPLRCLVEARVESVISIVERFHPTFGTGPAGEPVAFAAEPVAQSADALGLASTVRNFLKNNHVGVITRIEATARCAETRYGAYGSAFNPCPAALAFWEFNSAAIRRIPAPLPIDLEWALAAIFGAGVVYDAIIVMIPFHAAPRCMAECPPERPRPERANGVTCA